jgi:PAS domain S-box-containing protein
LLAPRYRLIDEMRLHHRAASLACDTGTFELDGEAGAVSLSAEAAAIYGFGAERQAGADVLEKVHEDDRDRVAAANDAALAEPGRYWTDTSRIRRADTGEVRRVRRAGVILEDGPGAPGRASGSITDVTDQRRAEQSALEAQATIAAALDAAPETVAVLRPVLGQSGCLEDMEVVFVNEAGRSRWFAGLPLEDVRGRLLFATWPEHRERLYDIDAAVVASGQPFREVLEFAVPGLGSRAFELSVSRFAAGLVHVGRDVTDEQAAARQSRWTAELLEAAETMTVSGSWEVDLATGALTWSAGMHRIHGTSADTFEPTTESVIGFYDPASADVLRRSMAARVAGDWSPTDLELGLTAADGRTVIVRAVTHVEVVDRRLERIVGTFQDVTERRRAEEEARLADGRRRRFFEANIVGTVVAQADGPVTEANDYWLRLVGRTRAELASGGIDRALVTAPECSSADAQSLDEVRERGTSEPYEKNYVRPDGTRVPVLIVRASMPGEGDEVASFVLDLTRQRAADEAAAQLSAAIEQAAETIVITDPGAVIQYVNPAFERTTGYGREEAVGRNPSVLKSGVHGRAFYQAMWAALLAGETWRGDLTNRRKDGSLYTEAASITPVRAPDGTTTAYVAVKRDVTERRRAQAELAESETRFAELFAGVDAILSYHDPRTGTVMLSPQTERILGFRPDELTPFEAWEARVHPDDLARCAVFWRDETVPGWDLEYRMRRADGAWLWVEDHAVRRFDADGQAAHRFSVVTDVTARRAAEAREQRLLRVQRAVADIDRAIARSDDRAELLDGACRIAVEVGGFRLAWAGVTEDSEDGREIRPAAAAGEALGYLEGFRARLDGDAHGVTLPGLAAFVEDRTVIVRIGGTMDEGVRDRALRWNVGAAATAPLRVAGRPVGLLAVYSADVDAFDEGMTALVDRIADDVSFRLEALGVESARLAAEEALRTSDELQRRVLEALGEGVVVHDATGRVVSANAAAERIYGVGAGGIADGAGVPDGWTASHDDGTPIPETEHPLAVAFRSGEPVRGMLMHLEHDDGASRWLRVGSTPLLGADGRVSGAVCSLDDVTAERELEALLRQSQRIEAVGQLAGGVAHDFNNLLTAIRGYTELARSSLPPDSPADADLAEAMAAADRASALTRQLLLFSRRERLETRAVDAATAIEGIAGMLRRLLGEHIALSTGHDAGPHAVRVDPGQFDQVIVNLAVNARDAMPEGGMLRIEVSRSRPDEPASAVRVTVADTGTGMDEATLERLFTPFFSTKPQGRGTGLGLATVHGIIAASGGTISVSSRLGSGTTFTVELPADDGAAPESREPAPGAAPPGAGAILLVEDDPAVRAVTARMLGALGYAVTMAADGAEALLAMAPRAARVDLVVTDLRMPGIQGSELVRRLREARPGLRALLVTGNVEDADETAPLLDLPVLQKPFTASELATAIREALERPAPGEA